MTVVLAGAGGFLEATEDGISFHFRDPEREAGARARRQKQANGTDSKETQMTNEPIKTKAERFAEAIERAQRGEYDGDVAQVGAPQGAEPMTKEERAAAFADAIERNYEGPLP